MNRQELMAAGYSFQTPATRRVILAEASMEYGPDFVKRLNGIFAFAIMDTALNRLCLFRDRASKTSVLYNKRRGTHFFFRAQGILAYPGVKAQLDRRGLNEVFSVGLPGPMLRRSKGHGGTASGPLPHVPARMESASRVIGSWSAVP